MHKKTYKITAETGVHARPATLLVNKAGEYESEIELHYKDKNVNLKSIMGVMSLGIPQGAEVTMTAEGHDAEDAIAGVDEVIKEYFGEYEKCYRVKCIAFLFI